MQYLNNLLKKKMKFYNKFLFKERKKKKKIFFITKKQGFGENVNNVDKVIKNDLLFFLGIRYNIRMPLKRIFMNIFGISLKCYLKNFIYNLGINLNGFAYQLDLTHLYTMQLKIKNFLINYDLKKFILTQIQIQKNLKLYHGLRHKLKLSVRGQRTKTNAQNQKKK